ncbi:hypothetical protein, partial [Pseudomonas syringae group genomosp. 7]|uniref:hypothetical protein n=1 Tax=Pseudomonas syringae group genomosp. 7 TaxID=251699 RepID=UPI00376FD79D
MQTLQRVTGAEWWLFAVAAVTCRISLTSLIAAATRARPFARRAVSAGVSGAIRIVVSCRILGLP